jgi:hypothetical protein
MKLFNLIGLIYLSLVGNSVYSSTMPEALAAGYKCRKAHDQTTFTYGTCVEQFVCERSGVPALYFSGAVPLDDHNECPQTAEDFGVRGRATANKVRIGETKIEKRANPKDDTCKPFPENLDDTGLAAIIYVLDEKVMRKFCIVGAVCSSTQNAEKRQGAVTCSPKPNVFWDKPFNGKTIKTPVCRDFDDCLVNNLAAPKDLLTTYLKKNGSPTQAVTSTTPHAPSTANASTSTITTGTGSGASTTTSVAQGRHLDSVQRE